MLNNNWLALGLTFAAALVWLRLNDFAAQRNWINSQFSRKVIHIGTGPIFVLCWLLFDNSPSSRYMAALVPLAITAQFLLVGLGVIQDESAVQAMSRTGDRREILRGPLFYGIVFVLVTVFYWLDTPIGITALMLMCGGDGLADILGRRWGVAKLPWPKEKSWVGSFGMFAGGWLLALGILAIYIPRDIFPAPISQFVVPITLIAVAATLVESLPIKDIDNLTVPGTALALGHILL